jgi:hypothetical protein
MLERVVQTLAFACFCICFVGSVAAPGLILVVQAVSYFESGVWPPFSILHALALIAPPWSQMARWIASPDSWLGLHEVLGTLHVGISLFWAGMAGCAVINELPPRLLVPPERGRG